MGELPVAAGAILGLECVRIVLVDVGLAERHALGIVDGDEDAVLAEGQLCALLFPERKVEVFAPAIRLGHTAEVVVGSGFEHQVPRGLHFRVDPLIVFPQQTLGTMHLEIHPCHAFEPEVAELAVNVYVADGNHIVQL